jgi:hypothetical protein
MTKVVPDYNSFKFYLRPGPNYGLRYEGHDEDEKQAISLLENEYYIEKSSFIYEDFKRYNEGSRQAGWPSYFTAYINGEVTITCDKTLYGEQPGTNLSSHFYIYASSECMPVGVEEPKLLYHFGEEIPTTMSDFFVEGSWFQYLYILSLIGEPDERYEELTLSITIPLTVEHVRDYVAAKYKGANIEPILTKSVFESDCLIKFNWE